MSFQNNNGSRAVAIVSGGLDSCGVASYLKNKGYDLCLLTFNYGQRAKQEIKRAQEFGTFLSVKDQKIIDISFMKELYGSTNALTDEKTEMPSHFQSNIIVPIRNAVFLTIATAYAFSIQARLVAYGAHLTDQPYPDCRPAFAKDLATSLNLGDIDAIQSGAHPRIEIWSPAVEGLTKDEMLRISYRLLGEKVFRTWSCYLDGEKQCGVCESCSNRRNAFEAAGIRDLTEYIEPTKKNR